MDVEQLQALLRKLRIKPQKERGQNYLFSPAGIAQIIEFGRPQFSNSLFEIGPGLGFLTAELLSYGSVTAVEIEVAACRYLRERFPDLDLIEGDFLEYIFDEENAPYTVFGNIPYSLSTEILFHLLSQFELVDRVVLLLQKEFAERIAAKPDSRQYGVLSISVQLRSLPRLGPCIPADHFYPEPKIDSQLIELRPRKKEVRTPRNWGTLRMVLDCAFFRRRKKILNSFQSAPLLRQVPIRELLDQAGIDPNLRAEDLTPEQFVDLADRVDAVLDT